VNYPAQNLDRLSDDVRALISYMFKYVSVGWTSCYMIEVKLDDPMKHLMDGGEGLSTHGGNGSTCYAYHLGDPDWAVIHCDSREWKELESPELVLKGLKLVRELCSSD
jgi:hypothetical protein